MDTRSRLRAGLVLAGLMLALAGALIASGRMPARVAYDQKLYHEPTIRQFAEQWPAMDLWHYRSATTPGYHVVQALALRGAGEWAMQAVSLAIAGGLALLLGMTVAGLRGREAWWVKAAACLPFVCSAYVLQSGAWLLPDNLGWLGVLLVLALVLRARGAGGLVAAGVVLLGLVLVRQIHAWTAGLIWLAGWLNAASLREGAGLPMVGWKELVARPARSGAGVAIAVLATVPALGVLWLFYRFWGGLVPPVFQGWYHSLNASAFVLILATIGAFGVFFAGVWWPGLGALWERWRGGLLGVLGVTLVACVLVPTNYDSTAGRISGLWSVGARLPMVGHTSLLMVGLALLGMVTLLALGERCPPRARLVLWAAVAGYCAASTANHDLFQRYVDPFALMVLALLAGAAGITRRGAAGPVLLAVVLLGVTGATMMRGSVASAAPPPAASNPGEKPTPAELPRPAQPPGKRFWSW